MNQFRMNDFQTLLINRLAHQVKNELTTLRLALFNLDYLLDSIEIPEEPEQQSKEFIHVMKTTLDQSIQTISYLLLITRSDKKFFKEIDIFQVLGDAIIQHEQNHLFQLHLPSESNLVKSDPKLAQLFFRFFLDFLVEHHSGDSQEVRIEGLDGEEKYIVFSGVFLLKDGLFFQADEENFRNLKSIQDLMLRQLAEYLQISVDVKQENENEVTSIILKFNQ